MRELSDEQKGSGQHKLDLVQCPEVVANEFEERAGKYGMKVITLRCGVRVKAAQQRTEGKISDDSKIQKVQMQNESKPAEAKVSFAQIAKANYRGMFVMARLLLDTLGQGGGGAMGKEEAMGKS